MVDHLLYRSIDKYKKMLETCRGMPERPVTPESFLVFYCKGRKHKGDYVVSKHLRAWRYIDGEVYEVPVDAKPVKRPEGELFYREAYGEFGICRLTKRAFINVYFGESFVVGFEYRIDVHGTDFMVYDEHAVRKKTSIKE